LKGRDGVLKPQPFDPSINSGQTPSDNSSEAISAEGDE